MSNVTSSESEHGAGVSGRAELGDLIRGFGELMQHRMHAVVAAHDLTPPLFGVLRVLSDPASMSDVADRLSCDASYVTGLADRLEERGLVERRPQPADRRVKQLALTDEGRRAREMLLDELGVSRQAFPELDDEEVDTLVRLLRKILA